MTFEVLLHRFAFVMMIISLFMLFKIFLLIIPISDFVGLTSLHVGMFIKSGLWSFNAMNASLLAEISMWSSTLRSLVIFLSTEEIESSMSLLVFL